MAVYFPVKRSHICEVHAIVRWAAAMRYLGPTRERFVPFFSVTAKQAPLAVATNSFGACGAWQPGSNQAIGTWSCGWTCDESWFVMIGFSRPMGNKTEFQWREISKKQMYQTQTVLGHFLWSKFRKSVKPRCPLSPKGTVWNEMEYSRNLLGFFLSLFQRKMTHFPFFWARAKRNPLSDCWRSTHRPRVFSPSSMARCSQKAPPPPPQSLKSHLAP